MSLLPRGLYGIADAAFGDPIALVGKLAAAGCRTIQLRAKSYSEDELIEASIAARSCAGESLLIINDSIEAAFRSGADGVHLGQGDCAVETARERLGPTSIIGLSTHSISQVQSVNGPNYIGFGPVFSTRGKVNPGPPKGVEMLQRAVQASPVPVIAIGGIHGSNISDVRDSGVHGWAIISALLGAPDLHSAVRMFDSTLK